MSKNLSFFILVDQSPMEVFNAVNNVRGWWSEEINGNTEKLNEEFHYSFEDVHLCTMKIIESVPGERVTWKVLKNYFKFTKDSSEWTGNEILFKITPDGDKTRLQFTQIGLTPEYECFDICQNAWGNYFNNSLRNLITTGKGQPNGKGKPQTENEKKLSTQ